MRFDFANAMRFLTDSENMHWFAELSDRSCVSEISMRPPLLVLEPHVSSVRLYLGRKGRKMVIGERSSRNQPFAPDFEMKGSIEHSS